MIITIGFCVLFWTNSGSIPPQNSNFVTTYFQSHNHLSLRKIVGSTSNDVFPCAAKCGPTSVGSLPKLYIYQLCMDTKCCLEELPRDIFDTNTERVSVCVCVCVWERERERERVSERERERKRERVKEISSIRICRWLWRYIEDIWTFKLFTDPLWTKWKNKKNAFNIIYTTLWQIKMFSYGEIIGIIPNSVCG